MLSKFANSKKLWQTILHIKKPLMMLRLSKADFFQGLTGVEGVGHQSQITPLPIKLDDHPTSQTI